MAVTLATHEDRDPEKQVDDTRAKGMTSSLDQAFSSPIHNSVAAGFMLQRLSA